MPANQGWHFEGLKVIVRSCGRHVDVDIDTANWSSPAAAGSIRLQYAPLFSSALCLQAARLALKEISPMAAMPGGSSFAQSVQVKGEVYIGQATLQGGGMGVRQKWWGNSEQPWEVLVGDMTGSLVACKRSGTYSCVVLREHDVDAVSRGEFNISLRTEPPLFLLVLTCSRRRWPSR